MVTYGEKERKIMKRTDFIDDLAERTGFSKKDVGILLEAVEEATFHAIATEDEVPFKFGKIGGKTVPAREGRNPATGAVMKIAEKKGYPYFKASARAKGKN